MLSLQYSERFWRKYRSGPVWDTASTLALYVCRTALVGLDCAHQAMALAVPECACYAVCELWSRVDNQSIQTTLVRGQTVHATRYVTPERCGSHVWDRVQSMCRFYFAYCEAAFHTRYIHDYQLVWQKQSHMPEAGLASPPPAAGRPVAPTDPVIQVLPELE